jgi:predicted RNA-binding Zn ribbon-like protein
MMETPESVAPTAASMRLDGGHPVLDLVNTVYGPPDGPVEHDVLATPDDLLTFARRAGVAPGPAPPPSPSALRAARVLRAALDAVLRARLAGRRPPADALSRIERANRRALDAVHLAPVSHASLALTWAWSPDDPHAPVHRLAHAAVALLGSDDDLRRLHRCAACCWLFLDRSRGAGRRWCSMADCGSEAKKRRYVERRRARRRGGG